MAAKKSVAVKIALPFSIFSTMLGLYAATLSSWTWYSYHPLLASLSAAFLVAGSQIKKDGGYANTKLHGTLSALGSLCCFSSFYVIWSNKNVYDKPHFTSYHGQLGLAINVVMLTLGLVGSLALHPDFGQLKTNKTIRYLHNRTGKITIVLTLLAMVSGLIKRHTMIGYFIALPVFMFITFLTL
tara:strand:+ start:232 stop:783 length:552 start_codon:yes stop_codon:yes gene_type:complete